ncbi:MAG: hypothetical protein ABR538_09330 [Candidatus Binatia bacterium]
MPPPELLQRTFFEDASRIEVGLPLGDVLGALHPGGVFPLVEDPRRSGGCCIVGMMVLRGADSAWRPERLEEDLPSALHQSGGWCFDVDGVSGSWPISGGNAVDAYRLALQYGVMDAVLAGAATVSREGMVAGARPGHLWQPYAPLSWPSLAAHRELLEPAIAALRRDWQERGLLSERRWPAQIAVTAGGSPGLLDARIFHDRHPDGTAIEAWLLTSEAGAGRLRESARKKGLRIDDRLLVTSPPGRPAELDVAGVPKLLRDRLDVRLAEHDGGALSLGAFLAAGAIAQLNLSLMRRRSVRDVIAASPRLGEEERALVLGSWKGRAQLFPIGAMEEGKLERAWQPVYGLVEEGPQAEAVVVTLDVRSRRRAPAE